MRMCVQAKRLGILMGGCSVASDAHRVAYRSWAHAVVTIMFKIEGDKTVRQNLRRGRTAHRDLEMILYCKKFWGTLGMIQGPFPLCAPLSTPMCACWHRQLLFWAILINTISIYYTLIIIKNCNDKSSILVCQSQSYTAQGEISDINDFQFYMTPVSASQLTAISFIFQKRDMFLTTEHRLCCCLSRSRTRNHYALQYQYLFSAVAVNLILLVLRFVCWFNAQLTQSSFMQDCLSQFCSEPQCILNAINNNQSLNFNVSTGDGLGN